MMEFIDVLLIIYINILLVNGQCFDWLGDDWNENIECAAVEDPLPETISAFKGTRVPKASPRCVPPPCPTTTPPPNTQVVVSYQRCLNFVNAYGADDNPNRAWMQGWCLVEEFGDGNHNCNAFKHGRRVYIPDSKTLDVVTNIVTKWGNIDPLFGTSTQRWHTGLQFHQRWWQWHLSNGDIKVIRPLKRKVNLPWANGEPDNANGHQNCTVYDWNTKRLADYYCLSEGWVLCQYPSCKESNAICKYWAGLGMCSIVDNNCQKSCSCDCIDKNRRCSAWKRAKNNACNRNIALAQHCKKTCALC